MSGSGVGAVVELPILVAFPWKDLMDKDVSLPAAGTSGVEACDATMAA
jgi:hypothetical protein